MFSYTRLFFIIFPVIFLVAVICKMGYDDMNAATVPSDTFQTVLNLAIFSASMTLVLLLACVFDSIRRRAEAEKTSHQSGIHTASEADEENISTIIV